MLKALEAQYWQARLFDDDEILRSNFRQRGFVIILPGPHLIEQEVLSAKTIIRTIIDIYISTGRDTTLSSGQKLDDFVAPWIFR